MGEAAIIARRASWLSRQTKASVGSNNLPYESSMGVAGAPLVLAVSPATSCSKRPDAKPDPGRRSRRCAP